MTMLGPETLLARLLSGWYRGRHACPRGVLSTYEREQLVARTRAAMEAVTAELPVIPVPQHPVVPLSVLMTGPASEPAEEHADLAYVLPQPERLIEPRPLADRALAGASS